MKNQCFQVPNLLNNQSDFLKFLLRHDFVLDDPRRFLKTADETPDRCIACAHPARAHPARAYPVRAHPSRAHPARAPSPLPTININSLTLEYIDT